MKRYLLVVLLLVAIPAPPNIGCTIVMVSDSVNKIAGSNEDSNFPLTLIWFTPGTDGSYSRVCLGYRMIFKSIQGGMNEKGLFIDGNSLGPQGWKRDDSKGEFTGMLIDHILATCADIEDVKEFFENYNVQVLNNARIPVMDKSGESMIIEWYDGRVVFLQNEFPYQVSTNFIESKYLDSEKPCWRYNRAMEMRNGSSEASIEFVRDVLNATHVEDKLSTTVYSFICDLENGDIYVYNYHDFTSHIKYNLEEEIGKGTGEQFLGNIFGFENPGYEDFIANGPKYMVERGCRNNRSNGILYYNILKMNYPAVFKRDIDDTVLRHVGLTLLAEGKMEDAIYFLEKNASEFPGKPIVFYDLGYGYEKSGNINKSIDAYNRAVELDPGNLEAQKALERLRKL